MKDGRPVKRSFVLSSFVSTSLWYASLFQIQIIGFAFKSYGIGSLLAVPTFPLEFVEPWNKHRESWMRKQGRGKTREDGKRKILFSLSFLVPVSTRPLSQFLFCGLTNS